MAYQDDPEVFKQAFTLYMKGDVRQAYDLLTEAAEDYPDHLQRIYEWRFDMAAKMGDLQLAEEIIEDALDSGYFYGEFAMRKDADVQVLQGRPFFESLVNRSYQMLADAQSYSRSRQDVIDRGKAVDGKTPLFMALHGNNSNAARFRTYWRSLLNTGWLVALPQSSQVGGRDVYVWNDMPTVEKELKEHYRKLSSDSVIDPAKTVISGFSKGGHAAITAAIKGLFPISGFIAVAPYIPQIEEMIPLLEGCPNRELRGYLLLGGDDEECTPGALKLHEEITKRGFQCGLEVFPELAHEFPKDFDIVLPKAIDFLFSA
jgi:predicted esterase